MRVVEPVLQRPLLQIWERTADEIKGLMTRSAKRNDKHHKAAQIKFVTWLEQLNAYRVLDPACGSGNFLFLGLKTLKDIEHKSHLDAAALGLDRQQDLVTGPHNVLGIELNEYAAELARVTVWIGELQWRIEHGYEFKTNPVLEPLDHIECRDALLTARPGSVEGRLDHVEAIWPKASVVIGNPPFLGDKKMRAELGDDYTEALRIVYAGRVPGGADLVTYWFEKARAQIEGQGLGAAGLVATNSIRQAANRRVLDRVCATTRIFDAWSDEPWVNEGAAVRVSLISQGWGECCSLNGQRVAHINADLTDGTGGFDVTTAKPLQENSNVSFFGLSLAGPFAVEGSKAREWLTKGGNPNGRPNSDVLRPIWNGADITRRPADRWVIDFALRDETDAALYELPFEHLRRFVKPVRQGNREAVRVEKWWRHGRPRPELRSAIRGLPRFIVTSETSKYRYFVWCPATVAPEHKLVVIPRSDDQTFGILSSRIHVAWAIRAGSRLGVGNDPVYTTSRCIEPFPFPKGLTLHLPPVLHDDRRAVAIARAAKRLNDLREAWLNPPEWTQSVSEAIPLGMDKSPYPDRILPKHGHEKDLAERTLTKLYNLRPAWLDTAHKELDMAVAAAYGWTDYTPTMSDEEILKRLLALNLERAAAR
jgi:type II restriction/modification system DNA methylase subunit YeeA